MPIVSVGFSDVIGSWKIIAICRPRTSSSSRSDRCTRSRPSNEIEPLTMRAVCASRPMIESAVTDLPQPDSPTMPSVRPLLDGEADAVDRVHVAAARLEVRAEVVDFENRHYAAPSVRGSSASRRPSAMKNALRMSHAIATLGMTMMCGCERYCV